MTREAKVGKEDSLSTLVSDVEKVNLISHSSKSNVLSTGITLLDCVLGGGLPVGQIVNIVGDASTGKSFLACEIIAQAKKKLGKKLVWFYDDVENRFNFDTKILYGFDIIHKVQENSYTIEDFSKNLKVQLDALKDDNILIYVLDSFDSLTSEAELKRDSKEQDKGTYGLEKVKLFGQYLRLRKKDIKDKNCILIIISQVRENITAMFGAKYYRTGGKALDHLASVILWLAEVEKLTKKKLTYGISTKIKATKTSNSKPFRSCVIDILFEYGVDDIVSNILYLYDLRTDKGARKEKIATMVFDWDGMEFNGLNKLVQYIETNGLEGELRSRVIQSWIEMENEIGLNDRKKKF